MRVDEDPMRTDQTESGWSSQQTVDEVEEELNNDVTDVLAEIEETPGGNTSSQIRESENVQTPTQTKVETETELTREVQQRTVQIWRNVIMKTYQGKSGRVEGEL